jgi:serine/threonine-protein kinase
VRPEGGPPAARQAPGYELLGLLGEGGMGVVELVLKREGAFARYYARKRLHPEGRRDPEQRAMFLDEGRLAGSVRHPNVVSVLDVGEDADGPFLIMELVEGTSVGALIKHAAARGQRLPVQICVRIALEAARGLHAAHEAHSADGQPLGLVHRDVSPRNLLVGFDGAVRVTDFGVAKALGNTARTSTGILKGNLGYLSPEQLRFEPLDRRSDLFSLGVTLFELLAGRHLYATGPGGDTTEIARRILHADPPDILEVRQDTPPALVELLFELLSKAPADRPASAEDVAERLEGILAALIAEEGQQSLASFLRGSFADLISSERTRVEETKRRQVETKVAEERRGRRQRAQRLGLVLGALALVTGGVALRFRLGSTRSKSPAGAASELWGGVWAGGWQTCATSGGDTFCWGKNHEGQLGIGSRLDASQPARVWGLKDVVSLGIGHTHACACTRARRPEGEVVCWGKGAGTSAAEPWLQRRMDGVGDCAQVVAGEAHDCALRADGRVMCWGDNSLAQLGAGARGLPRSDAPVEIPDLPPIAQLDADASFTCARARTGRIFCWGDTSLGRLGVADEAPSRAEARAVPGVTDAVDVTVSQIAGCVATAAGRALCWGGYGEPIRRPMVARPAPAEIPELTDVVDVEADGTHACARRRDGDVSCWGNNHHGQLGDGHDQTFRERPVRVRGLPPALQLAAGDVHTCARHAGGIACWGFNVTGQLGDATQISRTEPVSAVAPGTSR